MNITAKKILLDFLHNQLQRGRNEIKSHTIEREVVDYGQTYWGVAHNPSTYSRIWRKMKENNHIPEIDVINIETLTTKPEVTWILKTV